MFELFYIPLTNLVTNNNRQKTSGAEGERLKEAANINKSLSTLGYHYNYHNAPMPVILVLI